MTRVEPDPWAARSDLSTKQKRANHVVAVAARPDGRGGFERRRRALARVRLIIFAGTRSASHALAYLPLSIVAAVRLRTASQPTCDTSG
jgi:hypothetical protein